LKGIKIPYREDVSRLAALSGNGFWRNFVIKKGEEMYTI
jgi:hypothetical protein